MGTDGDGDAIEGLFHQRARLRLVFIHTVMDITKQNLFVIHMRRSTRGEINGLAEAHRLSMVTAKVSGRGKIALVLCTKNRWGEPSSSSKRGSKRATPGCTFVIRLRKETAAAAASPRSNYSRVRSTGDEAKRNEIGIEKKGRGGLKNFPCAASIKVGAPSSASDISRGG